MSSTHFLSVLSSSYYADVPSQCKVFHVCVPISDAGGYVRQTMQYSFFCGNLTVFSQDTLTCAHPNAAFPCNQAESFYDIVNGEFGRIPKRD